MATMILDFCGMCGVLVAPGTGTMSEPTCVNCNGVLSMPDSRIQGTFEEEAAERLLLVNGHGVEEEVDEEEGVSED